MSEYHNYDDYYHYYQNTVGNNTTTYIYDHQDLLHATFIFDIYPFEISLLGYIRSFLVMTTVFTNLLVLWVFMSKRHRRKPTNLLLASIAISDTLTGLALLPNSFHIYAKSTTLLSAFWCKFSMFMRYYTSSVFHTISVWQTVLLGLQRFLCVCHPFHSHQICTKRNTVLAVVTTYTISTLLHIYHVVFMDGKAWDGECAWKYETPCVETCVYLWFTALFQNLLPPIILVFLTTRTVYTLKTTTRRTSLTTMSRRQSRDRSLSIAIICIVVAFLIPELPFGIYRTVLVAKIHDDTGLSREQNRVVFAVYEIILLISFNINFCVYWAMMKHFRVKIIQIITMEICRKRHRPDRHHAIGSRQNRHYHNSGESDSTKRNGNPKTPTSLISGRSSSNSVKNKYNQTSL